MCGSTPQTAHYQAKDEKTGKLVERKIKMKDVEMLKKWTKGAIARRRMTKLIQTATIAGKSINDYLTKITRF